MSMVGLLAAVAILAQDPADIRVDVELVRIPCTVTDRKGQPARDLRASDFSIRDNGVKRTAQYFARDTDLPLTVGLVVDLSGSQRRFAAMHRKALARFFQQILRPGDRVFIVGLERDVRLVQDFTESPQVLDGAIERLQPRVGPKLGAPCPLKEIYIRGNRSVWVSPCGGSVIWDAVYHAAEKLRGVDGRKAILLLTDGEDSGSLHTLPQAIAMAQAAEAVVYPIKSAQRRRLADTFRKPLERLADDTGGDVFEGSRQDQSERSFQKIQAELRTQYVLGMLAEGPRDGSFHELKVTAPRGFKVRTRSGYWARKEK
jgi:VWFA-related protein